MSNPCLNGATCDDKGLSDEYTCTCPQGLTGQRCQGNIAWTFEAFEVLFNFQSSFMKVQFDQNHLWYN